ncbi:HNH endonuclease [Zobellia amurskyensis]|uniref:HNH endonuclease n=1 Tax=Zobellia amurskyensis TaxID=248905 RepID=A0A7X3D2Y2_9FLAO|nr:HNH endonuclease [Zobellia amurskyensis]MUH36951.1 HNH endonuclease [Zobellia amurskyensis]
MKPPKWHRDEVILALDLYHSIEAREMDSKNLKVIEVSEILNKLPIHTERLDNVRFRNPNGVSMKLNNFKAIDPDYDGKGMDRYSKLDEEVFFEFQNNVIGLNKIAEKIKNTVSNSELTKNLYRIGDDEEDEEIQVKEGKVIYKLHKHRERNPKLNKKKKDTYLKKFGKLDCEVCGFDFYEIYGELGKGFMECHHRTPLSQIDGESITTLNDLALVCANCHRMLHRELDILSVAELKKMIKKL